MRAQKSALLLLARNLRVPAGLMQAVEGLPAQDQAVGSLQPGEQEISPATQPPHAGSSHPIGVQPQSRPRLRDDNYLGAPAEAAGPLAGAWQATAAEAHLPVDLEAARAAAAGRQAAAMQQRLQELQHLPDGLDQAVRMAALIEQLKLQSVEAQRKLRASIEAEHCRVQDFCGAEPALMEWSNFRRPLPSQPYLPPPEIHPRELRVAAPHRPHALLQAEVQRQRDEQARQQAKAQAAAEQQRRRLQEEAEQQRRNELAVQARREHAVRQLAEWQLRARLLKELLAKVKDGSFRAASSAAAKRALQRNSGVRAWHAREAKKVEKEGAARLQLLKDNDYEAYVKLANEAKDQRLQDLLAKTDDIIGHLSSKVSEQREGLDLSQQDVSQSGDDVKREGSQQQLQAAQQQYYDQVHAVKQQVSQPEMVTGGQLRSYQLGGVKFLLSLHSNRTSGILADEMGLGKTVQTIAFLALLLEAKGVAGPHLILAPKAVLPNWKAEFGKWTPQLRVLVYDGLPEERKQLRGSFLQLPSPFHVMVTHYDLAMRDRSHLKKMQWRVLIVDEGHRLKNADSKLVDILREFSFQQRLLLTGTPIQNSLAELWALLNFVLPNLFASAATFDAWFAAPFQGQGEAAVQQLNEEEQLLVITRLHQVLRPFVLRRTKQEVEGQLPAKTEHHIHCPLSAWQALWYRQIAEQGRISVEGAAGRGLRNTAMQLRKVCNHPYLMERPGAAAEPEAEELVAASGKLLLLDSILPKLQASGHRVLLFSQMTKALDLVEDLVAMRRLSHLRLDGSTKTEDRAAMLEAFNAPASPSFMFLLSTRAGGLGLNLQSADTVIFFDSDWNPQMDLQAEDRAHRIGQKREVLVLVLVAAGTIEQAILEKAKAKRDIDAKVIQAGMFNDRSTHAERQAVLQRLMTHPGSGSAPGSGVHAPTDVNRMLARCPAEFDLFQQMDQEALEGRPQLMDEAQVPAWAREQLPEAKPPAEQSPEVDVTAPRKRRRPAEVSYAEPASDWSDEDSDIAELADSVAGGSAVNGDSTLAQQGGDKKQGSDSGTGSRRKGQQTGQKKFKRRRKSSTDGVG